MNTLIIIASVLAAAAFFLPEISITATKFSAFDLTKGLETLGVSVIKGNPLFALELVFPLIITLLWVGKNRKKEKLSIVLSVLQLALMVYSIYYVRNTILKGVAYPSVTFWFILAVVLMLVILVISLLYIKGKANENTNISQTVSGVAAAVSEAAANFSAAAHAGSSVKRTICPNCGTELDEDDDFCSVCGTKKPVIKLKTCINCGKELNEDEDFCPYCGTKYIDPALRICRNCGALVRPGTSFCGKCGTKYEDD